MFKLALIQMLVRGGDRAANLHRAAELVSEAAAAGAAMALLPEAMDLGWTDPSARRQGGAIPDGEACRFLRDLAEEHALYLCAGLTEESPEGVFNAAVILGPDGRLLLHHRKLNELGIGHHLYGQGDRLGVCHTPLGTIGLMICADGFARDRVIARSLGYMGADIILSPSAWAVEADHDNRKDPYGQIWRESYIPVAREFAVWIVGVSGVGPIPAGPWAGRKCIGCSLVIAPDGREVLEGPYGQDAETILYVDIEPAPRPGRGCGWEEHWQKQGL